ncbi:MAG: class B sortase [Eubacterium sp.]|nr:class B sortase [Eubacterium sp.]
MKWNLEWVDLQNIEHMVAECWRMGGYQLDKYVQKLTRQQDLIFAGELGIKFLELLQKSVDEEKRLDWASLQKDIHLMQELIQDGQAQHDVYWRSQYQELTIDPSAYFNTEFGKAFTEQLAAKLDLNISEEQRMLRNDIGKIQKICATCNWDDEEQSKKALALLTRDEKYYFSSWLGDAFINVLQQRYGKKEAEEESGYKIQPKAAVRGSAFRARLAWTLFLCIAVGMISLLLYMQSDNGRGAEKIKDMLSEMFGDSNAEAYSADMEGRQAALDAGNVQRTQEWYEGKAAQDEAARQDETALGVGDKQQDEAVSKEGDKQQDAAALYEGDSQQDAAVQLGQAEAAQPENVQSETAELPQSGGKKAHIPDKNTADTGMRKVRKERAAPDVLPQYASFYKRYPDLFGWLKIPGTQIDHPVMQSDDKTRGERYFYLHRDHTGKQSEAGSLFVENASSCYPQDANTVIYGHNMSSGVNFGILENYKNAKFFQEHPLIQYDTIYEEGTYQIVAVLITRILYQDEEGFRYYRFYNYGSEREFQECADFVRENQLYDTGTAMQYGDRLLMLSTCEYSKPNGRLVVVAKRID